MEQFKVGDLVRVVHTYSSIYGTFESRYNVASFDDIVAMNGHTFTVIEEMDEDNDYLLSNDYYINSDDLELVEREYAERTGIYDGAV